MDSANEFIKKFKVAIEKVGGRGYLVGRYIRDKLIDSKSKPKNIDLIYEGDIVKLIDYMRDIGYEFSNLKSNVGIYKTVHGDITINISLLEGKTIQEDLQRIDFTINAIAMNLTENKIIDPFNGRNAVKSRIIQRVTDSSISDDPVRILRGIKLYISKGMHFNLETEQDIMKMAYRITYCDKKRVFSELMRIIKCDKDGKAFEILDSYNILKNMFPYIEELKKIGKCKYHIEDVFTHMNLTYSVFKDILNGRLEVDGLDLNIFDKNIGDFRLKEYIAFTCFLHDIGKFNCYKKVGQDISFYKHDKEGAKIAGEICEDMMFPKESVEMIQTLIEGHMYPLGIYKAEVKNMKKTLYKFFEKYGQYTIQLLILSFCDIYATTMLFDPHNDKEKYKIFIEELLNGFKEYIKYCR